MRALGALAGVAALAVLTVVAASVAIRLGASDLGPSLVIVRGVHRASASLAALLVFVLSALGLRRRELRPATIAAFALTVALSIVGWVAGTEPPRPAAAFNQLGGIALAAILAWIWGRAATQAAALREQPLAAAALLLATLQAAYGGALAAAFSPDPPPAPFLLAHAALGLAAAATVASLGLRFAAAGRALPGFALIAAAALAPLLGAAAAVTATPLACRVAHAFAAALLLAAAAHAHARVAASA